MYSLHKFLLNFSIIFSSHFQMVCVCMVSCFLSIHHNVRITTIREAASLLSLKVCTYDIFFVYLAEKQDYVIIYIYFKS